jgi:hypothetical protein
MLPILFLVIGIAVLAFVFAPQLGTLNERFVQGSPSPVRSFYRALSFGQPYDSSGWIAYYRIGSVVAVVLVAGMVFLLRRGR